MIKVILCDFARVLSFPKDVTYIGRLDKLHEEISRKTPTYNSFDYFSLNTEILQFLQTLKPEIALHIYTTGLNHRVPDIQEKLVPVFEKMLYTGDLNVSKTDPNGYLIIAKKLGMKPNELLFLDDTFGHVEAAQKAGLHGVHFKDTDTAINQIKELINTAK